MNFERVATHDGMHEIMDDGDHNAVEEMEDCSAPTLGGGGGMGDSCARGILQHNNVRSPERKILVKERYVEPEYPRLPSEGNLEWQYTMRRTMQEIIPGLFLGPYASATRAKLEEMKAAGLTHVVCVRQNLEKNLIRPNHPDHFKYLVVEIADSATENIIPHFKTVNRFLDECLSSGGKALVHGNAGISRSAALVIAFIMSKHGVTLKESFSFVQSKRFCCNPNEGFMAQLREYEPIYRALHTVPLPLPADSLQRGSMKRTLDYEDTDPSISPLSAVMDTSSVNFQFGVATLDSTNNGINGVGGGASEGGQQTAAFSSSESSVSSSSESLPHVISAIHRHQQITRTPQPTDTPMSMS